MVSSEKPIKSDVKGRWDIRPLETCLLDLNFHPEVIFVRKKVLIVPGRHEDL